MTLHDQGSFRLVFPAWCRYKARCPVLPSQMPRLAGTSTWSSVAPYVGSLDAQHCSAQGSLPANIPSDDVSEKKKLFLCPLFLTFSCQIQIALSVVRTEFPTAVFNLGLYGIFRPRLSVKKPHRNCLDTYYSQQKCFPTCSFIPLETATKAFQITNKNFG